MFPSHKDAELLPCCTAACSNAASAGSLRGTASLPGLATHEVEKVFWVQGRTLHVYDPNGSAFGQRVGIQHLVHVILPHARPRLTTKPAAVRKDRPSSTCVTLQNKAA